jgi:threonine dehydrogenase-like Zn-dependent dehydrogenase
VKGLFVVSKNKLDILEVPDPDIGEYEALVEVKACGICNSTDLKIIEGRFKKGKFPILLGHESVGKVVKRGKRVLSYKDGDMVLRSRLYDKHVSAKGGSSRFGGFVEKAIVTDVWAEKGVKYNAFPHPQQIVPASIEPEYAAVMITLKENLSCIENSDIKEGHSLAIVGTGPAAQSMAMFAKLSGISPIVIFGRRVKWVKRFTELGVDAYVVGDNYPPEVLSIINRGGFDRVIEAVGSKSVLSHCLQIVKPDGKVNLYGMPADDEPYRRQEVSDPRVLRPKVAEAEVHDKLLKWIDKGRVDLADWVDRIIYWKKYQIGFDIIKGKKASKVILTFNK